MISEANVKQLALVVTRLVCNYALPLHALARTEVSEFFRNSHQPLFFDGSLSFSNKIEKWRVQSVTSLQLVTNVLMLSLLAVGS